MAGRDKIPFWRADQWRKKGKLGWDQIPCKELHPPAQLLQPSCQHLIFFLQFFNPRLSDADDFEMCIFWSEAKVNTQLQEKVRESLQQRDDGAAWGFKDAPCLPYGWGSHQISAVFASQPFWLCLISHQFQIRAIRRLLLIRLKASPLRPKWLREKGEGTVDASHILSKQCPHTPRGSIFGCTKMTRLPGGINAGLAAIYRLSDPTGDMQADKHNTDAL